ncbi:MAG: long-chain-fatty-acid--CoA ligase [Campylobacterales bacterium]|nr:long-chain-fatty-acid--CoA ligase [Campylobacterales bacterium]
MAYPFTNFYEMITSWAKESGKKTALFVDDEKIRYRDILERADRLADFLEQKGIGKGDRVALFLRNSPEFVYSIFAASKLGAIVVPINTFLKEEELSYILEDSGAKYLIASGIYEKTVKASRAYALCNGVLWEGEFAAVDEVNDRFGDALSSVSVAPHIQTGLDDTAVIIYTSGTTGKPKGAMLSHRNIFSNAVSGSMTINVTSKDRAIVFLPMFHSFTFSIGVILPLHGGASIVIIKSIQPFSNIFKQVLLKRVSIFFGVPDVYNALSKAKLPWYFMWFNNIRAFISGAAALQPKTLEAMAKKFKRATLLEGYGLSEAAPAVSMNTFEKQKAGSVGTALSGYEIKIVDENLVEVPTGVIGDIIIKGDNVMQGYLGRPESTAETIINGWLLTGDMGYLDEEGFLFIVDRKKDLIISKGINIYPREIEEMIDSFEGIGSSAVIGIEDEKNGEIPVAYLELEEGVTQIDEVGLKAYLRKQLANYKIPKQIHIIESLPKNATGKVLKRLLKDRLRDEALAAE